MVPRDRYLVNGSTTQTLDIHLSWTRLSTLRYSHNSLGDPRRRLEHHEGEFLVHGGISADEYRILACFWGDTISNDQVLLSFPLAPVTYHATIPANTLPNSGDDNRTELRSEMCSLIGVRNHMIFCALVLALCCCGWELGQTGYTFAIKEFSWFSVCKFQFNA